MMLEFDQVILTWLVVSMIWCAVISAFLYYLNVKHKCPSNITLIRNIVFGLIVFECIAVGYVLGWIRWPSSAMDQIAVVNIFCTTLLSLVTLQLFQWKKYFDGR